MKGIIEDDRPIHFLTYAARPDCPAWDCLAWVGRDGITKIVAYGEPGHMANRPWFAIYKGDHLFARVAAEHVVVWYAPPAEGTVAEH
jgi:hypothetical protein